MASDESEKELLKEISTKLSSIMGLLAANGKDDKTKILILQKSGMTSEEIGSLMGVSGSAIRKQKMLAKRKK